jgi:hypothetical protein
MTTYQFTPEQYTAYQTYIAKYLQARVKSGNIGTDVVPIKFANVFRSYSRPEPHAPYRGQALNPEIKNNIAALKYTDFDLCMVQDGANVAKDIQAMDGNPLLADTIVQLSENIAADADKVIFAGSTAANGIYSPGLIGGATAANVTTNLTAAFGNVKLAISTMLGTVPAAYHDNIVDGFDLYVTNGVYSQMMSAANSTTGESEMALIQRLLMGPNVDPGWRINSIIQCNALSGKTTLSTSNQIMLLVPRDIKFVSKAISFDLGVVGDEEHATSYEIQIGWKGAGIVKDALPVIKANGLTTTVA